LQDFSDRTRMLRRFLANIQMHEVEPKCFHEPNQIVQFVAGQLFVAVADQRVANYAQVGQKLLFRRVTVRVNDRVSLEPAAHLVKPLFKAKAYDVDLAAIGFIFEMVRTVAEYFSA